MNNYDPFRLALTGDAGLRRSLLQAYRSGDAQAVVELCRPYRPPQVLQSIHESLFLSPFLALGNGGVDSRRQQQDLVRLMCMHQDRADVWRQFWQLSTWLIGLVDKAAIGAFFEVRRTILARVAIWSAATQMGYLFEPLPPEHRFASVADWHFQGTLFRVFGVAEGRGPRLRFIPLAADAPAPAFGRKLTVELETLHHQIIAEMERSGGTYLGVLIVLSDAGFHPDTGSPAPEVVSTLAYFLIGLRA